MCTYFFPKIPIGKGYIHIGDSIIYIASILMGPAAGMFVGAIGHSLADIISGFPEFCIPTLIIKALLGYAVGMLLYKKQTAYRFIISAIVSFIIVTGGYFIAETLLFGYGVALVSLMSSPIQCLASMTVTALLMPVLLKYKRRLGF